MNTVTVSQKAEQHIEDEARLIALELGLTYVSRNKLSLSKLFKQYTSDYIIVFTEQGPSIQFASGKEHHFHLSMAQLRLLRLERGEIDNLVQALYYTNTINYENYKAIDVNNHHCKIKSILDCTMGLGSDSIIMSYAVPTAKITALETVLPLWYVTTYGLKHFVHDKPEVTDALRRIDTVHENYIDFLGHAKDNSFDIIYFDPMFEVPIEESPQFKSLRGQIEEQPMTKEILTEAKRVAKQKVIIKERPFASIFKQWPPSYFVGGKYSRIGYGIYEGAIGE